MARGEKCLRQQGIIIPELPVASPLAPPCARTVPHPPTWHRIHPPAPRLESLCHFLCGEGRSSPPPPHSDPFSWGLGWTVGSPSTSNGEYLPRRGHSQQTRGATSQRTPGNVRASIKTLNPPYFIRRKKSPENVFFIVINNSKSG